jgi:hypothetical protein
MNNSLSEGGKMRIYLDLDGVLADFEHGCQGLLGMPSREFEQQHGPTEFWCRLAEADDFYSDLPLMPDALRLFDAVQHLQPTILTGLPKGRLGRAAKTAMGCTAFPWCADHRLLVGRQVQLRPAGRPAEVVSPDKWCSSASFVALSGGVGPV